MANSMFSRTVMLGYSAYDWNTMAMSRSLGLTPLTTRSPMAISPSVVLSSPAIMFSSVDLPHPEGPTRIRNSPSAMSMSMPLSTGTGP